VSRLPILSGQQVVKALERAGFVQTRTRGSHVVLRHADTGRGTTVPLHKVVKRGTLAAILRQTGIDAAEFEDLL
jgi:predicted RNA binding protein YcfA (HicA-like mRNA interferase family)